MTDREMLEMLVEGQRQMLGRLDGVDAHLNGIDTRLDGVDARLDGIDMRLDGVDSRFDKIDEELASIKNRQDTLEGRQRLLEKKFDRMVNVDIKHLIDTQDTIVVLLQANGTIPTESKSIRA